MHHNVHCPHDHQHHHHHHHQLPPQPGDQFPALFQKVSVEQSIHQKLFIDGEIFCVLLRAIAKKYQN